MDVVFVIVLEINATNARTCALTPSIPPLSPSNYIIVTLRSRNVYLNEESQLICPNFLTDRIYMLLYPMKEVYCSTLFVFDKTR